MNHLVALERKSDGRWDYTYNGHAWGYCRAWEPLTPNGVLTQDLCDQHNTKMEPFLAKFHSDGHATKEEACHCYKEYLLDTHLFLPAKEPENPSQAFKCKVCGVWTACMAQVGSYQIFHLCPEHSTREHVAALLKVGESWES